MEFVGTSGYPFHFRTHADGVDGASPNATADATSRHTINVTDVVFDDTQSVFGGTSFLFNGTTALLYPTLNLSDFEFDTGDFTVDFWIRKNGGTLAQNLVDFRPTAGTNANNFQLAIITDADGTSPKKVTYAFAGVRRITSTTSIINGAGWYHIALTRKSGTSRLFVNGVQEGGDFADSFDHAAMSGSRPLFGRNGDITQNFFNGWMDEIRIIKGYAVWDADFDVPTEPYGTYHVIPTLTKGRTWVKHSGTWKRALTWAKSGGVWRPLIGGS